MGVGDSADTQFFGEGVFDRIDENQGELEWSSKLVQREENWTLMGQLVFLMGLIAIAALGVLIVMDRQNSTDSGSAFRSTPQTTELQHGES